MQPECPLYINARNYLAKIIQHMQSNSSLLYLRCPDYLHYKSFVLDCQIVQMGDKQASVSRRTIHGGGSNRGKKTFYMPGTSHVLM